MRALEWVEEARAFWGHDAHVSRAKESCHMSCHQKAIRLYRHHIYSLLESPVARCSWVARVTSTYVVQTIFLHESRE